MIYVDMKSAQTLQVRKASKSRGATETTLHLAVAFAEADWAALRPGARRLLAGRMRRAFVPVTPVRPADLFTLWDDDAAVSRLQAAARRVLDARIAGRWDASSSGTLIANALMPVAFKENPSALIEKAAAEVSTRILLGLVVLLATAGDRLRRCPECGRRFVRVRRQLYCGSKCTDRATWRNYPKEKKRRLREQQYAKYGWRLGARTARHPSRREKRRPP